MNIETFRRKLQDSKTSVECNLENNENYSGNGDFQYDEGWVAALDWVIDELDDIKGKN